jgi:hypothetical protein
VLRKPGILILALGLLIVAAGLRFSGIGAPSLWNDEGNSYVQATRTPHAIIEHAARDIHPPGYYLLLAGWRVLMGESETALRLLSAFASLITVALAFALGRRLYGDAAGIAAGAITALHSFSLYYAGEMRMYALLALWVALGFWCLVRLLDQPTRGRALALAVVTAAGLYTQYVYPLFMLAQGAACLLYLLYARRERKALHVLVLYTAANLLAIAVFAPWLPTAVGQISTWSNIPTVPIPPDEAFAALLRALLMGIAPTPNAPAIAVLLLLIGALIPPEHGDRWRWLLPIAWVLLPVGIIIAIGAYQPDDTKLMLPAQVGAAIWFGRGVWVFWTRRALAVRALIGRADHPRSAMRTRVTNGALRLLAVLSLSWMLVALADGIGVLRADPAFQRADYRTIAAAITASPRPGDAVVLTAPNQAEVFGYYYRGAAPVYPLPVGLTPDDAATQSMVEALIASHTRIFAVFWGESERDPRRIVETTLDAGAFEIADDWYGDVRLVRYAIPGALTVTRDSDVRFGGEIVLERYALTAESFVQGETLHLALTWRTDSQPSARYVVFTQLLDADGRLAIGRDSEPSGGLSPTTTWTPGEEIVDRGALPLDLPPGTYTLIVGMYPLGDPSARLMLADERDHLTLATITLSAP